MICRNLQKFAEMIHLDSLLQGRGEIFLQKNKIFHKSKKTINIQNQTYQFHCIILVFIISIIYNFIYIIITINTIINTIMSLDNINNIDERVIWEFTIGIPITYHHSYDNKKELFEDAVIDITRELTQITEGLTYQYCYGTWSEGTKVPSSLPLTKEPMVPSSLPLTKEPMVPSSLPLTKEPMVPSSLPLTKEPMVPSSSLLLTDLLLRDQRVERNYSVRISIVVLPEIAEEVYNSVKDIISNANIKYGLDVKHIQAMKSYGTARHFITREPMVPSSSLLFK